MENLNSRIPFKSLLFNILDFHRTYELIREANNYVEPYGRGVEIELTPEQIKLINLQIQGTNGKNEVYEDIESVLLTPDSTKEKISLEIVIMENSWELHILTINLGITPALRRRIVILELTDSQVKQLGLKPNEEIKSVCLV